MTSHPDPWNNAQPQSPHLVSPPHEHTPPSPLHTPNPGPPHRYAPPTPHRPVPQPPKRRTALWVSLSIAGTLLVFLMFGLGLFLVRALFSPSGQTHSLPSDFDSTAGTVASSDDFRAALEMVVETPGYGVCRPADEVALTVAGYLQLNEQVSAFPNLLEVEQERVHIYVCTAFDPANPPQNQEEWEDGYLEAIYIDPPTPDKASYRFSSFSTLLPASPDIWSVRGENWVIYSLGFTSESRTEAEGVFGQKVVETYVTD